MKCPKCAKENPVTATVCDCGYDFVSVPMTSSSFSKEEQIEAQLASSARRFFNFIIDEFIICFIIISTMQSLPLEYLRYFAGNELAGWLFGLGLILVYYILFEMIFQKTPAKFITSTKVVMADGSKPDAFTIVKRSLIRLVPFEPFSGFFSGAIYTWWHDRWTKTRVIY